MTRLRPRLATIPGCIAPGVAERGGEFSLSVFGCSVSTVKKPVALANLYRLQSIATDNKKTMHSVSTVLDLFLV